MINRCEWAANGPVIVYAQMQATGMVNDHVISCFRYKELQF
jgi:DNA-3-methyladenine glycosylase I